MIKIGGRNYPYRGGKQSSLEGGSRATSFIKFPSHVKDLPREFSGLGHVSDVMPTVLGYIDRLDGSAQKPQPLPELGLGYDLSLPILGLDKPKREDVLMAYEPTTNKLGYRYKNWKIVSGNIGDYRRFEEPTSNNQWTGNKFHDIIAESLMVFQHGIDEDASGTIDEVIREVFACVDDYWGYVTNPLKLFSLLFGNKDDSKNDTVMLFDLSVDPFEDNDISESNPKIVAEIFARISIMKENFLTPTCDWFVMDRKVEFEKVIYNDVNTGENVTKMYHSPWVPDEEYDDYEPHLFNVNHSRKILSAVIVLVEGWAMLTFMRKFVVMVIGGGKGKVKED